MGVLIVVMKENKKVQYVKFVFDDINVKASWFRKRFYEITWDKCDVFEGIMIAGCINKNGSFNDRQIKSLAKRLNNYDISEAVIIADENMSRVLDMKEIMFQAKKYEFIHNCSYIIDKLQSHASGNESIVIVLDSSRWDTADLFKILAVVKNNYRKIDIITGNDVYNLSRLSEVAYEEWGVILHIYSYNSYHGNNCDMALLFLKNADRIDIIWKRKLAYKAAYIVEDKWRTDNRKRHKDAFSGLVYKAEDIIPYELGVNMAYQKPLLYEKFHVYFIDICEF